jgi:hypothetical protein
MPAPRARTSAEAHLYMALNPCPGCGDEQFHVTVHTTLVDGDLLTRYTGPCRTCTAAREFSFDIGDSGDSGDVGDIGDIDSAGEVEFGRDEPSALIDAGQWLTCAERIIASTPTTILGVSEDEWRARRFMFRTAAESVGEVLKFIPDGADAVPPQAFWTDDGRAARDRTPDRFRRAHLHRLRAACLELVARYED